MEVKGIILSAIGTRSSSPAGAHDAGRLLLKKQKKRKGEQNYDKT